MLKQGWITNQPKGLDKNKKDINVKINNENSPSQNDPQFRQVKNIIHPFW